MHKSGPALMYISIRTSFSDNMCSCDVLHSTMILIKFLFFYTATAVGIIRIVPIPLLKAMASRMVLPDKQGKYKVTSMNTTCCHSS